MSEPNIVKQILDVIEMLTKIITMLDGMLDSVIHDYYDELDDGLEICLNLAIDAKRKLKQLIVSHFSEKGRDEKDESNSC